MKKKRLGRGLGSLIGNIDEVTRVTETEKMTGMVELGVDQIQRGKYQPRVDMHPESLQDLADSIKAQGLVQPIIVRPIGEGKYEIIAG